MEREQKEKRSPEQRPRVLLVLGMVCGLLVSPVFSEGAGTAGSSLLRISGGSRSSGMGNAYTGLAEDTEALFYNPAGLALLNEVQIGFSYLAWLTGLQMQSLSYGQAVGEGLYTAGNLTILPLGGAARTLENASGEYAGEAGSFSSSMTALTVGLGLKGKRLGFLSEDLKHRTTAGISVKLLSQSLDGSVYNEAGLDLGALVQTAEGMPRLGAALQNIGILSLGEQMPMVLRLGASQGFFGDNLMIAGDYAYDRDGVHALAAGGEWVFNMESRSVSVRCGASQDSLSTDPRFALGFGYVFLENNWYYVLDYALVTYPPIGHTHRVSFSIDLSHP